MRVSLIACLAATLASGAQSQDPDEAVLPEIVVRGTAPTEVVARGFIEEVTTTPTHALSLARWMTPICIGTINMQPEAVATISARIESRARSVGVGVQPSGCSPNITLLATSDGRFTATELVDAYPKRFLASNGPTQGDREDLQRFAQSEAAVRWWTISALVDERSGDILVPIWGAPATQIDTTGEAYFGQNRREALLTALVILDLSKTEVGAETLGDYLAMVVLSQVDPEARGGGIPTILNLWQDGDKASELTAWDRAYLKALYEAPVRLTGSTPQVRSLYQRTEMARIMAREMAAEGRNR